MLTLVALMLVGGSLGDQFGRRRMFVAGLVGFGATSALCAIAPSDEFLIGARALQGIAGALLVPGSLAIVAATFEGAARGKAVGTWTAWTGIATVLGPAGGGAMVDALDWRCDLLGQPAADRGDDRCSPCDTVAREPRPGGLPRHRLERDRALGARPRRPGLRADRAAGARLVRTRSSGCRWSPGIVCFALFLRHEARAEHPMLDLGLFRIRNFWVANLTTFTAYAGLIGGLFFVGALPAAGRRLLGARGGPGDDPDLDRPLRPLAALRADRLRHRPAAADERRADRRRHRACCSCCGSAPTPTTSPTSCPRSSSSALGLSATVAPLTATVLDSVEERHVGIASGRQQRRLAGRRAAGDRHPRRGDLRRLRLRPRRRTRRRVRSARPRSSRSRTPSASRSAVPDTGGLPPAEAAAIETLGRGCLDRRLPPRDRNRRDPDDPRRRRRRSRHRQPAPRARRRGARAGGCRSRPRGRVRPLDRAAVPVAGAGQPQRAGGRRDSGAGLGSIVRARRARLTADRPAPAHLQRHPADRPQAPRQLHRRDPPVRRGPGSRRPGDLLHRRPARDHGLLRPGRAAGEALRHHGDPARGRARPGALHPLPPVRRARAHRADLAAELRSPRTATSTGCTSSRRSRRSSASWSRRGSSSTRC